jgi:hypothetical protein
MFVENKFQKELNPGINCFFKKWYTERIRFYKNVFFFFLRRRTTFFYPIEF